MSNLQAFEAKHPKLAAWWANADTDFKKSLRDQADKKGYLSDRQIFAALRQADTIAQPINTKRLESILAEQIAAGKKKPSVVVDEYKVWPAPSTGANPGALYVKHQGNYLGKIVGGKFLGAVDQAQLNAIIAIAAGPKSAAAKTAKKAVKKAV